MIHWIKEIICLIKAQIFAHLQKEGHSQGRVGHEETRDLSPHQMGCSIPPATEIQTDWCSY